MLQPTSETTHADEDSAQLLTPDARGAHPRHIIGASIPRSGHHLLARLLEVFLGDRLFYCEAYADMGCCRSVPCRLREQRPISFQKSHDFDLTLPRDIPDALYLIQHRPPVPVAVSAREYYADERYPGSFGAETLSDHSEYAVWLGRLAAYFVGFWERWLDVPPPGSAIVEYDDLAARPHDVLAEVLDRIGVRAEADAIDQAVAWVVPRAGPYSELSYAPRALEARPAYVPELLAPYESAIVEHLPVLAAHRQFPPVAHRETLVGQIFEARRLAQGGDALAALTIVERAIEGRDPIGLLLHERAFHLQALSRHDEAYATLRNAVALTPPHPVVLDALVTLSLFVDDQATAVDTARALVDLLGVERAGPVAAGLADTRGPLQGKGRSEIPHGGVGTAGHRIRHLRSEVVAREVALRRSERLLIEKEQMIAMLATAAHDRLNEIERLTALVSERDRAIDAVTAAAEERLDLLRRLTATLDEERHLRDSIAAIAQERLDRIGELYADLVEKQQVIDDLAAAARERAELIDRLTNALDDR